MKQFLIEILVFVAIGLIFIELMELITDDRWTQGWWAATFTILVNNLIFPSHGY